MTQDELDVLVNEMLEEGANNERRGSEKKAC